MYYSHIDDDVGWKINIFNFMVSNYDGEQLRIINLVFMTVHWNQTKYIGNDQETIWLAHTCDN